MLSKNYALYAGVLMIAMGALSLIPSLVGPSGNLPLSYINVSYGLFLGTFPMNIVNKLALLVFGVAGILCYQRKSFDICVSYCKLVFFVFGALAVLGLFPATNTLAGFWPLFGGEVGIHGLFAIAAGGCAVADTRSHTIVHA